MSVEELEKLKKEYERLKSINKVASDSYKVLANSGFGAFSNQHFLLVDYRIAEGITLTGQYIIRQTERAINTYLNKMAGTKNKDFVIAIDTDSNYISLNPIVQKFFPDKTQNEILELVDAFCKDKLVPVINKDCEKLANYLNFFDNRISFKRESIAVRGFWTAKKRYALLQLDNEGVRYAEPKPKIMGMETVRTDFPNFVRGHLKEAISVALNGTQNDLYKLIDKVESEFYTATPEKLGIPKGCNNMTKWSSPTTIFQKGTPYQAKASLIHNHWITELGLEDKYPKVRDGDKVKLIHLIIPNPIRAKTIAFLEDLPPEFKLHDYIDVRKMFDKVFIKPLSRVTNARGWNTQLTYSLDDLF